jgi:hypothetical protein
VTTAAQPAPWSRSRTLSRLPREQPYRNRGPARITGCEQIDDHTAKESRTYVPRGCRRSRIMRGAACSRVSRSAATAGSFDPRLRRLFEYWLRRSRTCRSRRRSANAGVEHECVGVGDPLRAKQSRGRRRAARSRRRPGGHPVRRRSGRESGRGCASPSSSREGESVPRDSRKCDRQFGATTVHSVTGLRHHILR